MGFQRIGQVDVMAVVCATAVVSFIGFGCANSAPDPRAKTDAAPTTEVAEPAALPAELRVNGPVVLRVHAQGFQIYTLVRGDDGAASWKLKAPDATFSDGHGIEGRHYAGPTWECTTDGSKVIGRRIAEDPSPDANAIPWLLLSAASHQGQGVFSGVTFIQRLNTTGGKPPAIPSSAPADGTNPTEAKVPYSADYVFYGAGATKLR